MRMTQKVQIGIGYVSSYASKYPQISTVSCVYIIYVYLYIYIYIHHSRIHAQVMHPNERPDRFSPCITSPGSSVWRNSWNPSRTKSPLKSPSCNSKMTSTTWLCQWNIYDILEHTKLDRKSTNVLSRLISSLNLYFHMISILLIPPDWFHPEDVHLCSSEPFGTGGPKRVVWHQDCEAGAGRDNMYTDYVVNNIETNILYSCNVCHVLHSVNNNDNDHKLVYSYKPLVYFCNIVHSGR